MNHIFSLFLAYACCRARTAECLSCISGQTIPEYCRENPGTVGCQGMSTSSNRINCYRI